MLLIFVVIGYVAHPLVLPLTEDKLAKAEVAQEVEAGDMAKEVEVSPAEVKIVPATQFEPPIPEVVEESPVKTNPSIVEDAVEPVPMVNEVVEVEVFKPSRQTDGAQVVTVMQKSVKAGEVTDFSYDVVKAWEYSGEENIEGTSYDVGVATVELTTILGVDERKVKALCRDGVVVRWLWAASGVEIE